MQKQLNSVEKVEKALEKEGVKGWMVFGFIPPGQLVYTRSKYHEDKIVKTILKCLIENPSLKEMFRSMVNEIDRGLTTEPIIPEGEA